MSESRLIAQAREACSLVKANHEDLRDCGPGACQLLEKLAAAAAAVASSVGGCVAGGDTLALELKRSNDLLRLARDNLHAFPYKDVPLHWRRLYTDASIIKAAIMMLLRRRQQQQQHDDDEGIVAALDMALIMTGAPGEGRKEVIASLLEALEDTTAHPKKRLRREELKFDVAKDTVEIRHPVGRWEMPPSLEEFQKYIHTANRPIIICGAISHWPALQLRSWSSPEYLLSLTNGGKRLVPVEVGRAYTDASWGQKIVTFRDFLDTCMTTCSPAEIGYLAQHTLFSQIPALRNDITIPDYCYSDPGEPPENVASTSPLEDPLINAWLGPRGTVSPLHTDPYANVLAQVMGSKYVRLYAPGETARVFPKSIEEGGVDMSNTSRVEVEAEGGGDELTEEEREEWKRAKYVECVLKEGELLFIPAGWWHYVRSLEASFSVSFWWN
ncbi:hypothetical protein FN846DRAFT_563585 [Sphaerosporella brunnea]|uniref:JmjC domain-containing protein n=1 Tax=Sphaerosporella brunnea TaxID=1250544 RepID=A0A5J5FB83_9PEZI|nr:hypothetical protein FN846DRAFT_563585 [Sphaerosporella brunnea]